MWQSQSHNLQVVSSQLSLAAPKPALRPSGVTEFYHGPAPGGWVPGGVGASGARAAGGLVLGVTAGRLARGLLGGT